MLNSVLDLMTLSVVETIESAYQITCDPSDPLERYSSKVIIYLSIVTVKGYIDRVDRLAGIKVMSS